MPMRAAGGRLATCVQDLRDEMRDSILFVTAWLGDGGVERQIELRAPWLAARGHRVEVATWFVRETMSGSPNPILETLRARDIPIRRLSAVGRLHAAQRAVRLAWLAWRGGFRVVVAVDIVASVVALLAKRLLGGRLRVVIEVHNASEVHAGADTSPGTLRLARRLYRHADAILAVSRSVRLDAAAFFGLDPARITQIYNPIQVQRIRARAALSTPQADGLVPFILGCGRLARMKAFGDLIAAFARVRARSAPDLRLVILGEGPERAALERHAAALGVDDAVVMPGFVANPYPYFARAEAFVLSSHFGEALGLVLLEAMACGVPVIASRCHWGPEEVLGDGDYGVLYDVGDIEQLADAIAAVLHDPATHHRTVLKALAHAEEFADDRLMPELEAFYLGLGEAPVSPRADVTSAR